MILAGGIAKYMELLGKRFSEKYNIDADTRSIRIIWNGWLSFLTTTRRLSATLRR